MNINDLISKIDAKAIGACDRELTGLTVDSREVKPGMGYIAISGTKLDGNDFVDDALKAGAIMIVSEKKPSSAKVLEEVCWVQVSDARLAAGLLGAAWNHNPSDFMKTVGITGTNGKTTTAFLIHSIFRKVWQRSGLIGTVFCDNGRQRVDSKLTTPGPLELQNLLGTMLANGCRGVAMEVSSQALDQKRTAGMEFDVGIFTNFTQDHLDYHHTMEEYFMAKVGLFEQMSLQKKGAKKPVALINIDDPYGKRLVGMFSSKLTVKTYGFSVNADFRMLSHSVSTQGCEYELIYKNKSYLVRVPLIGRFNMYNSIAALAGAVCAGVPVRDAVAGLANTPQVPGRMELVAMRCGVQAFVDYAHTPDALENVCKTLKELAPKRLITVFGCGGNRDAGKRPEMGAIASKWSDICVVTSDNPRQEDPERIIKDVLAGMPKDTVAITDRTEAINAAVMSARKGDILLIAGKGHENYQELAEGRIDFNDMGVVRQALLIKEEALNEKFKDKQ